MLKNYIKSEYSKSHQDDIVEALLNYLTSETMLAHISKHIGLKDLVLTNVSSLFFSSYNQNS